MKRLLLKSTLLLCALVIGSVNVWAQSDYSTTYTSNVTLSTTGGSKATASTVVISENSYGAIKLGSNGNGGSFKITAPSGTKYLHLHAAGWNGKSNTLSISGITGYTPSDAISLTSDSGVSGSGTTYTISAGATLSNFYKVITLGTALTSETEITISCSERCVVWGVNAEIEAAVAAPTFSPAAGEVEKGTSVSITTSTAGADIYYTTDGSTPSSTSTLYSSALTINAAQTIKAIAIKGDDKSLVATAAYTIKKVETPTFSVAEGAVIEGTAVEIETATDGATIYYTTDGTTPTTSSNVYSSAISIDAGITIKAIAVKSNWDDSEVASATYTVLVPVSGLSIDFETNNVSMYVDWEFSNIEPASTAITAHGGTYYGNTDGKSTAYIKTNAKVANPNTFTCYISKESGNTTACDWKIQVSSDGSAWTDVATKSASSMSKGAWEEFTTSLTDYHDVYVRLWYGSNTAIRAVDDITLTEMATVTVTSAGWASFSSSKALDFTGTDVTAYIAKAKDDSNVTLTEISKVPANTGIVVSAAEGTYSIPVLSGDADGTNGNLLKPWLTAGTPTDSKYYTLAVSGGNPVFRLSNGGTLAAGKSYLVMPGSAAPSLGVDFGSETTGVSEVRSQKEDVRGEYFNLNGQRVAQPTKGLYIVNGRKVVVK